MSNFITNAELRIEAERLCDENEKLREENEMLRNYRAEHEKAQDKDNHIAQSDLVTYDVLDNERHKAVCELQKINVEDLCKQYDYIDVYAQYVWAIGEALGIEGGGGFESIINRLIHLLSNAWECEREVVHPTIVMDEWDKDGHLVKSNLINLSKSREDGDAVLDASTVRRREVVERLKKYREHPPVRDVDGPMVENTYSVSEIESIVTGKELFTTGEFIDSLISLIDERKEPICETYTDLTVNMDKPAEAPDAEDTRESLEEDVHVWCALYPAWTYAGKFRNKVFDWLDRQAAITERNCRVEYEDMRDCLLAVIDGLEDDTNGWRKKCAYLQEEINRLQGEVEHLNKALEAYRSLNALLHGENMELRRTVGTLSQTVGDHLNAENEKLKKLVALQQEFSKTICGSKCKRKDEYCGFTANEECHYEHEICDRMRELGIEADA